MVVEYANHLLSQGHDVVIAANVVDTVFDVRTQIETITKADKGKISTILKAILMKRNSDVIVADIIVMTLLLSLRNREKLVYFAQDYDESYYKYVPMKWFIRAVYFYCLNILKIPVIAVSEDLGSLLRQRFNANVTVIPNGVDTAVFYPDRDERYFSLKGGSKVILVFARSDYRKGFDIAITVLTRFKEEIENDRISVWAVGEDIYSPFKMRNFGFVKPEELRKILSCADLLLYPSRHEGLPLFILEAMACGCAVITTTASEAIAQNGINALVSPLDDSEELEKAVIRGLSDELLRTKLIGGGIETATRYELKKSAEMFEYFLYAKSQRNGKYNLSANIR